MINVQIRLCNPWVEKFENLKCKSFQITKNKTLELQMFKTNDIINFQLTFSHRTDHAGLTVELGLLSYNIMLSFLDNRHWDDVNKKWENYD